MDYTDCNDFLWPIEIFGFKKQIIISGKNNSHKERGKFRENQN
jgi:hypothetical protein